MRFKKGSKVEIWDTRDAPSGCWCPAVIISGNGHYYSVKHHQYAIGSDTLVEKVPRRAIRPCPPSGPCPHTWLPGDIVEVYQDGSWRLVEVLSIAARHHFLVRLLGSDYAFEVHASNTRLRLQWKDDKWFVIGMDAVVGRDPNLEGRFPEGSGRLVGHHGAGVEGNVLNPQRGMKRGSKGAKSRAAKRLKAVDEDGVSKSMVAGNSLWLPGKDKRFFTWELLKSAIF